MGNINQHIQQYLAQSQNVRREIEQNQRVLETVEEILSLRNYQPYNGVSWQGNLHEVYRIGQLESGLWVVARTANDRVFNKIGDLEYCAQTTAERSADPEKRVPQFCVGVWSKTIPEDATFYKMRPVLLLTEDMTEGGRYNIRNVPDQEFGIREETGEKVYYDFDVYFNDDLLEEKAENPLFFRKEHRIEL